MSVCSCVCVCVLPSRLLCPAHCQNNNVIAPRTSQSDKGFRSHFTPNFRHYRLGPCVHVPFAPLLPCAVAAAACARSPLAPAQPLAITHTRVLVRHGEHALLPSCVRAIVGEGVVAGCVGLCVGDVLRVCACAYPCLHFRVGVWVCAFACVSYNVIATLGGGLSLKIALSRLSTALVYVVCCVSAGVAAPCPLACASTACHQPSGEPVLALR